MAAHSTTHRIYFHWMFHAPGLRTAQALAVRDEGEPRFGRILYPVHAQHRH